MKWRAIVFVVLLILTAGGIATAQQPDPPTLEKLIGIFSDGSEQVLWELPTGSPTSVPTDVVPTLTPTIPLPTPSDVPATPQPTPTATPILTGECILTVVSYLNVRPGPSVESGARIGVIYSTDQHIVVDDVRLYTNGDRWAHITTDGGLVGWSAMVYNGAVYAVLADTAECNRLTATAVPIAGYHVLVGATENILLHVDQLGTMKCLTHSEALCLAAKDRNPELKIVYRSLFNQDGMIDGPSNWEWYSPASYYAKLKPYWASGFDYYEYINEWNAPSWSVRADWEISMMELMGRDHLCGLFGSFGPGNPPMEAWEELLRVFKWIDENPCSVWPDGTPKYHGLAIHQTGVMPAWVPLGPDSYIGNIYITHRHEIVADYLRESLGYDLEQFKGPIYVTEMGWENYTIPDEQFSCEEVAAGFAATVELYLHNYLYQLVDGFHLWNLGGAGGWVDLTNCLNQIHG